MSLGRDNVFSSGSPRRQTDAAYRLNKSRLGVPISTCWKINGVLMSKRLRSPAQIVSSFKCAEWCLHIGGTEREKGPMCATHSCDLCA